MNARTKELNQIMDQHNLTNKQAADLLGLSETTIKIYRCRSEKTISAQLLELLKFKVEQKPCQ